MQVMTNLLSNAIKFSPRGETVSVDIQPADLSYRVSVSNSGEGIPVEFRDRIFSRFAQADASSTRAQGGTGLGLSIVKEIITRLMGEVGFNSSPGEGATFYFTLPATELSKVQVLVFTAAHHSTRGWPELADRKISGRFAGSIDKMCELLKTNIFAAVILDLRLPEAHRAEAVQAIQFNAQNSPLIILAGYPGTEKEKLPLRALLASLERPAAAAPTSSAGAPIPPPPGGRILHVEDDEDILSLVASAFGAETEVIAARNLHEGLDVLRRQRLDAVILDLELGDECGVELLPSIRRLHPAVPIIIFAASDTEASAGAEVNAVLTKSRVTLDEVVSTVRTLITSGGL